MKRMLIGVMILLLVLVVSLSTMYSIAEDLVPVTIDAPDEVGEGYDFIARVSISGVENFDACNYDITYNSTVLEVTGVTNGLIGNTTIPVSIWGFIPPETQGTIRVVENVPGLPGVSGSGYLAEVYFDVVGEYCNTGDIDLCNGTLSNNEAEEIYATWIGDSVHVYIVGDANMNGVVNMGDVTYTELIILGYLDPTPGADCDRDGDIDMGDVTCIGLIILGG